MRNRNQRKKVREENRPENNKNLTETGQAPAPSLGTLWLQTFKKLVQSWVPKNRTESLVLCIAFLLYFLLALPLLIYTEVIGLKLDGYWGYLRYDNAWYFNYYLSTNYLDGWLLSRHPFLKLLLLPLICIGQVLKLCFGTQVKLLFWTLFFQLVTAESMMLVYRYLETICRIGTRRALLLTAGFGSFFTNLILSFTPESFPISQLLLLTALTWISADLNARVTFPQLFTLSFLVLGITTSNVAKVLLMYLFTAEPFVNKLKKITLVLISIVFLYGLYFLCCLGFALQQDQTVSQLVQDQYINYNNICEPMKYPFLSGEYAQLAFDRFWVPAMIGPTVIAGQDHQTVRQDLLMPQLGELSPQKRVVASVFLIVFLVSAFLNRSRKETQILLAVFAVDITLHLILLFGHSENHIYAAHWMFVVPLMCGWLYRRGENGPYIRYLDYLFLACLALLFAYNIAAYLEFFQISYKYLAVFSD